MPQSHSLASALLTAARATLLGTAAAMATACAQADPVAPAEHATLRSIAAVTSAAANANGRGPQACMPDAKLIGRFAASTADVPGTWWRLTKDRFNAAGVTDYKSALESFYGQRFNTLGDAIQFLIDGVVAWDANGNGYVCAYEVRGTRAHLGVNATFLIGIADDKHFEN